MRLGQRGQVVLEAVLVFPVVLLSMLILSLALYGLYLQANFQHQADEYLLCAEFGSESRCQKRLQKKLSSTVPFGHWQIATTATSLQRQVQIDFFLKEIPTWKWRHQSHINRDLSSSSF
jgi:hypothetical protein